MDGRRRITSLDIVRGAVMVLMAIDHVRVYSGLPAGGPTAGIFFTRWVTHFCAPGLRLPRRYCEHSCKDAKLGDTRRARPLSAHPRTGARVARAHRHPFCVDLQRQLLGIPTGRCHLDARLVHGGDGSAGPAAGPCRRGHRARGHFPPADLSSAAAVLPQSLRGAIGWSGSSFTPSRFERWDALSDPLRAGSMDRRDGRWLCDSA